MNITTNQTGKQETRPVKYLLINSYTRASEHITRQHDVIDVRKAVFVASWKLLPW